MGRSNHSIPTGPGSMDQLARKKKEMTKPFDQCPICSGELVTKEVEKLLRGGNHTAVVRVSADVCLHCGERLYSTDTVKRFEEIRTKLTQEQTTDFQPMGHAFQVTG
jgi:YgiT-type zinc finger domain-containing protein